MLDMSDLEPKFAQAAKLMEMLAQPSRLKILCILSQKAQSVQTLADIAELSQPAMSHHLRKLREADLVETKRDGQVIYYSLKGEEVKTVLAALYGLYCA